MIGEARYDSQKRGELFERFRPRLRRMAERTLSARLRARLGASDIVQETFVRAETGFPEFQGSTLEEFAVWLTRIHRRNLVSRILEHRRRKRDWQRERGQPGPSDAESTAEREPAAGGPTPSVCLMRSEKTRRLAGALATLGPAQRLAIEMRYLQGRTIAQVAVALGKSPAAVEGLIKRGLQTLRERILDRSAITCRPSIPRERPTLSDS